jgi:SAM-dependent methyltransferase
MENYFIKKGYQCNWPSHGKAKPYLDDKDGSSKYQIRVYRYARDLMGKHHLKNIMDVGCGFGIKLKEIIRPVCEDIVGIDKKHAIDFCKSEHRFGQWIEDDIENPQKNLGRKFDLVLCSDVIEHLADPDNLLKYVEQYCHEGSHIVISTPDRDKVSGKRDQGPPINRAHVREWNRAEFRDYISNSGFGIINQFLVAEGDVGVFETIRALILLKPLKKCQVVHCRTT